MELKLIDVYTGWSKYSGKEVFNKDHLMTIEGLETINNIENNSENKLAAGDRVYFSTLSSVPRYKFSEYCKNKDIARTILFDKCNTYVIGKNIKGDFKLPDIKYRIKDYYKISRDVFMNATGMHISNHVDFVYTEGHTESQHKVKMDSLFANYPKEQLMRSYADSHEIAEYNELYKEIESCKEKGIKIVNDDSINTEINQGVVIDDDVAKALREMLDSKQHKDVGMAMEVMANCHYKESEYQLMMLLHEFRDKINQHKNRNLVNFKGLIAYFKDFSWNVDERQFIKTFSDALKKRGLLSDKQKMIEEWAMRFMQSDLTSWKSYFDIDIAIKLKQEKLQ